MVNPAQDLPPAELHHLRAAEGWLELGNCFEAQAELDQLTPQVRELPAVLELRWHLCAATEKWADAVEIADTLVRNCPENPEGWIHRSYALHELKRTAEARDQLLPAADKFPRKALIRYNLACYECQLGNLDTARRRLTEAFALDRTKESRLNALSDPDLRPLWPEISNI